jgi:hypothetical protein
MSMMSDLVTAVRSSYEYEIANNTNAGSVSWLL